MLGALVAVADGLTARVIPEFPDYAASDDGRIWSSRDRSGHHLPPGCYREMKLAVSWKGYYELHLTASGVRKKKKVHSLVLMAFVGPRPEGMECCHGDGNRKNCSLNNLRWDTPKANSADKVAHGRTLRGERSGTAKLSYAKVAEIRNRINTESADKIAKEYGVSRNAIVRVATGKTWAHTPTHSVA
jgi:hypothetical protein